MKILKSTSLVLAAFFAVSSIYGLKIGLPLLLFCLGLKECINAKEYYDNQQKKFALASFGVGIFVCVCAFLSLTNII
jgi:hypothetical protein